jgi:hypothetical protein
MNRQLLVIMELRCSEDYALFISQGVIQAYLKLFMDKARQRSDINDLDFTDYEVEFRFVFERNFVFVFLENSIQRNSSFIYWTL